MRKSAEEGGLSVARRGKATKIDENGKPTFLDQKKQESETPLTDAAIKEMVDMCAIMVAKDVIAQVQSANPELQTKAENEVDGEPIEAEVKEVPAAWMCLYRHFGMEGGVFDCGYAFIEGVYDTFEEADARAKEVVVLSKNAHEPRIWVMRCVRTYNGDYGIAESPIKTGDVK